MRTFKFLVVSFWGCKLRVTWFCWDGRSTCHPCGFCFVWMCWRCWATNAVVQAIGQFGGRCEDSSLGAENWHSRLDCLTGRLRLWFSAGTRFFISRSVNYDKLYMINHSGTKKMPVNSSYILDTWHILYILVVYSPVWHLVGNICMKISRIPIWPAQQLFALFHAFAEGCFTFGDSTLQTWLSNISPAVNLFDEMLPPLVVFT